MKLFARAALPAALALCAGAATAQSLPIVGGTTSVKLTSAATLAGLGLSVETLGSAQFSPGSDGVPLVYFPVTGGTIDTATFGGAIEHEGSGLRLFSPTASVSVTNFVVDTTALTLFGDVTTSSGTLSDAPLFSIGTTGNPFLPFSLTVTAPAGAALAGVFGVDLSGAVVGLANTVPITSAVPEPATVASMLAGLALLGAVAARRRAPAREGVEAATA